MSQYSRTAKEVVELTGLHLTTVCRKLKAQQHICGVRLAYIRTGDDSGSIRISDKHFEKLRMRLTTD